MIGFQEGICTWGSDDLESQVHEAFSATGVFSHADDFETELIYVNSKEQLFELLPGDFSGGDIECVEFDRQARFEQLVVGEVADGDLKAEDPAQQGEVDLSDPGAASGAGFHQPEKLQSPQRFAHADPAHAEKHGHLLFRG